MGDASSKVSIARKVHPFHTHVKTIRKTLVCLRSYYIYTRAGQSTLVQAHHYTFLLI
jgi:hypothetical protein